MGFFKKEKSVPKTNVFDTLNMDGYYLPVLLPKQQTIITSITFSSCSQTAVIQGIGGILQIYFYFNFRIAYCGVHLFLNEFLKSAEKLIAEKYNYKNWITNQLYTPFDNHHIQEKDILP
ncbi:hypothetical protein AALB52_02915 [Lachnospiraceae bacterium 38-14]|jgi:hypothetical protein